MGLLALGTPLDWPETKPLADHIRHHGITQFLHTWNRWKDNQGKGLLWGDEADTSDYNSERRNSITASVSKDALISQIEYMVVSFDDKQKKALLSLRQTEILMKLQSVVLDPELEKYKPKQCATIPTFHPEYGRYMLESTPGCPFTGHPRDLVKVEADMRFRRKIIRSYLKAHELPMTITAWPRLGVDEGGFTEPPTFPSEASSSKSQYVAQEITNPHARFPTLTANIRQRRGSKVDIRVPLFIDENTPVPEGMNSQLSNGTPPPAKPTGDTPYIHMDAMAFGMGCCCLQITFQAWNVDEARRVYDALVPIAPIMLALTAASPAFRGQLADVDARWNVIAASVDDRTEEERGLQPLKDNRYVIPKSRYDSVDLYISNDPRNLPEYHDTSVPIDESVKQRLMENGLDAHLSTHIAHLFIRDPLVQFSETIDQDDESSMDHFENIQSTNWQTIRFKPPPVNSPIGWRVEFRSMEVQMTDFENAAFSVFIVLLTRAIVSFDLGFYMPISQVDENMQKAQQRDGARVNKYAFRRNVFPADNPVTAYDLSSRPVSPPPNGTNGASSTPNRSRRSSGPANGYPPINTAVPSHLQSPSSATAGSSRPSSASWRSAASTTNGYSFDPHRRESSRASTCSTPVGDEEEEEEEEEDIVEMTIDEIINGRGEFPGLMGLVNAYLNSVNVDLVTKCELRRYLDLIKYRAKGDLCTPASWIRNFITSHPKYQKDSKVTDEINYDLAKAFDEIERGVRTAPELLGKDYVGSGPTGCL